jgi:hypothetical protein
MFFSTWRVPDLRARPGQVLGGADDRGDDVTPVAADVLPPVGDLVRQ